MTIIYCITHLETGRYYIGKTRNTLLHRWRGHVYARNVVPTHICRSIRKYGKEAFVIEELARVEDSRQGNELEKIWISLTKSYDPSIGFNMTLGGDGGDIRPGRKHTEETKQKISQSNKGKVRSSEWCRAISVANKGKRDSDEGRARKSIARTGLKHSPETLAKMALAQQLRYAKEREQGIVRAVSPETRLKLSEAGRRRKDSDETKMKKSIAARQRSKQLQQAA